MIKGITFKLGLYSAMQSGYMGFINATLERTAKVSFEAVYLYLCFHSNREDIIESATERFGFTLKFDADDTGFLQRAPEDVSYRVIMVSIPPQKEIIENMQVIDWNDILPGALAEVHSDCTDCD